MISSTQAHTVPMVEKREWKHTNRDFIIDFEIIIFNTFSTIKIFFWTIYFSEKSRLIPRWPKRRFEYHFLVKLIKNSVIPGTLSAALSKNFSSGRVMLIFQRVQRDETTFCRRRASRGMATWHKWRPSVNSDRPRKRRKKTFSNKYIQKNRAKREFMNFSMQHRRRVPLGPRRGKRREILKFFLSHNLAQAKCVCINSIGSNSILIRVEKQQEREEGTKKKL